MNRGACAVLLALLALVGPQAAAHQQKEAVTRVVFNPRTGQHTAASSFNNGSANLTPPANWGTAPLILHLKAP